MTSMPAFAQRVAQNDLNPNIEFVKSLGAGYLGVHEYMPVLPAPSNKTRRLCHRWPSTLPPPSLSPGFHRPFCLRVFWVPLAPRCDLDGRAALSDGAPGATRG